MENLTKNVKYLKTKNDKLEGEIISVWHGADNWRSGVIKINDQILDEVKKGIENDLNVNKLEQDAIEHNISAMKEH